MSVRRLALISFKSQFRRHGDTPGFLVRGVRAVSPRVVITAAGAGYVNGVVEKETRREEERRECGFTIPTVPREGVAEVLDHPLRSGLRHDTKVENPAPVLR